MTQNPKETQINRDFMAEALKEANRALKHHDVPIGAVIVKDGVIIARGHNIREDKTTALGHAELVAIAKACRKLGSWRLLDCDVYVTLEPCPMCAAALSQARVRNVYYGAHDPKGGAVSLGFGIESHPRLNHRYSMIFDDSHPECGEVISRFFRNKRQAKKNRTCE